VKIQKENTVDMLVYALACIFTLGAAWVLRIIITYAIRRAIEND